jgi:excisionase family DNA binding protein
MVNTPKLVLMTPDELDQLIQSSVRKALSEQSSKSSNTDDFPINIDEAAAFIKKPKSTVYQLTSTRDIPFAKKGKTLVFFKKDLLAWLETGRKKTKKEIESEGFSKKGGVR